ncbi:MAG: HD domain-containing protein [Candidatus Niyogibacteria bacterium]|nr:HD domain-containing protein [Candidatus Niyogibacteria bacterium]
MTSKKFQTALAFVQKKHRGQKRAGGVPAWHHLARVSEILSDALERYNEGVLSDRRIAPIAALGHDVLEDTKATPHDVRRVFGERGFELIWGMTNEWGDAHRAPYVKKVIRSEELVRLMKLSDLADNLINVAYAFSELGEKWTSSYFLPIVTPMRNAIRKTRFVRYPKTAAHLIRIVDLATLLLEHEQKRFRKRKE